MQTICRARSAALIQDAFEGREMRARSGGSIAVELAFRVIPEVFGVMMQVC
jgi:hypothetical protein